MQTKQFFFGYKPRRILYRIVLPFALLLGTATILCWLVSAYFITHFLDQHFKQQMEQVARVISRSSYVLNPAILLQLKQMLNSEIILFDRSGQLISSTIHSSGIMDSLKIILEAEKQRDTPFIVNDIHHEGGQYKVVVHPFAMPGSKETLLSLWIPAGETEYLNGRIVLYMGGIALAGILAMAVIGYFIARTITAPLEELAKVTERVAMGDMHQKANIGTEDEIGMLARSFNHMTGRLLDFRQRLVESERLATAGRMAAGLAHEIRNPLTSIKMLGQVLHNRLKDQTDNQRILTSLIQEIDRLDRIIQGIIDRTKPGELRMELGDLNRLVEEVLEVIKESLCAQGISMEINLLPTLPRLLMDHEKLKQVLWNLILNAKESMPRGGHLMISTRVLGDGNIELLVVDSGQGIEEVDVEKLYQPFVTTKPEGLGLGLTICRKIVERHGGGISLENRPEGGVKSRVILPKHKGGKP